MATETQVMGWFKRWTPVVKEARAFVLAVVALLAAIAALITALKYVGQAAQTREQTKTALTVLAAGQDQLAEQSERNYKDIAALREYIAKTTEVSKVPGMDDDGVPDDIQRVATPPAGGRMLVGAGGGGGLARIGGSRTPPPPVTSASASESAAMAPPEPPEVSPPPAPPKSLDVDSVFY